LPESSLSCRAQFMGIADTMYQVNVASSIFYHVSPQDGPKDILIMISILYGLLGLWCIYLNVLVRGELLWAAWWGCRGWSRCPGGSGRKVGSKRLRGPSLLEPSLEKKTVRGLAKFKFWREMLIRWGRFRRQISEPEDSCECEEVSYKCYVDHRSVNASKLWHQSSKSANNYG